MNKVFKYCFVFICQQGELEIKSLLLALSLKRFLQCEYELVAGVPGNVELWGEPANETVNALQSLDVRIEYINNPIGKHYPIGNKLEALDIQTDADKIIFLDSDILCMQNFEHQERFSCADFHAKAADVVSYGSKHSDWELVYGLFDLPCPKVRMRSTVSYELMLPYYNAGFVAISRGTVLAKEWVKISQKIDVLDVPDKYPWLDQISLPIAIFKLALDVDVLDERYNYPLHLKPLDVQNLPFFCHYHTPEVIRREPVVNRLFVELVKSNKHLHGLIKNNKNWMLLLNKYQVPITFFNKRKTIIEPEKWPNDMHPPELIITGIPRSGTSYLCKLLHQTHGVLAINEPENFQNMLCELGYPWKLATYYRTLRQQVLDGGLIENKVVNGVVIEDTAKIDRRAMYSPRIDRANFILATKNTLAYTSRISSLKRAMPRASLIACVRNPFDTIASWKASFKHLKEARVANLFMGGINDVELSTRQRNFLCDVEKEPSEAVRRAMLWSFLAERIFEGVANHNIIRYEDLCANPAGVVTKILKACGRSDSVMKLPLSEARGHREVLDWDDVQAIRMICSPTAALFGYKGN